MKLHPHKVIRANNRKGIFVVLAALMLPVLFGCLALATDMGWLYHQRRRMQNAADAGALYGAQQIRRGANTKSDVESYSDHGALKGTADNGFTNGEDGTVVTVEYPLAGGDYAANNRAVGVTVCQQQRTFFMPILGVNSADVCAAAIAGHLGQAEGCIYALNPTEEKTMHVHSNTTATVDCGVIVNSNNPGGLYVASDACLSTSSVSVNATDVFTPDPYNLCGYGNGEAVSVEPYTETPREPDPLIGLGVPPEVSAGCYQTDFVLDDPSQLPLLLPNKKWCKGLKIDCATCGTITLPAGNYVIAGKKLEIVGSSTVVHGTGVLFFATNFPAQGEKAEGILVGSGVTVNFSAPSSGDFEGILMYVDRNLSEADGHYLNIEFMSGATADLNGALYTANGTVTYHSGLSGTSTAADGIAIVADIVDVTSNTNVHISDDFSGFATGSPIKRVTLLR